MAAFIIFLVSIIGYSASQDLIVTNNEICTDIGKRLMHEGGTAPEVFIGIALCEGVVHPQDSGIGGGMQAVVYNSSCGHSYYLNARERSPKNWSWEPMQRLSASNSIGVPSALKGYERMYLNKKCGYTPKLTWSRLFVESIDLLKNGRKIDSRTARVYSLLEDNKAIQLKNGTLTMPLLAETFRVISHEGPSSSLYKRNGLLNRVVTGDLNFKGSLIDNDDFYSYTGLVGPALTCKFRGLDIITTKLPGSGRALCFALVLTERVESEIDPEMWLDDRVRFEAHIQVQRYMYAILPHLKSVSFDLIMQQVDVIAKDIIVEIYSDFERDMSRVFKFGDLYLPNYEFYSPYGTTNVVVKIGDTTIVATSTINWSFGSRIFSGRTGIIFNNQLDDFSKYPNHPNERRRYKYPQSSICASIAINGTTNETVFMAGAAGGKKILGAVYSVYFHYFINEMSLTDAMAQPRCLTIDGLLCEYGLDDDIAVYLKDRYVIDWTEEAGYSAVTAATTDEAVHDPRRGGSGYIREN